MLSRPTCGFWRDRIYAGHDCGPTPTSTISRELAENRFLRCQNLEELRLLRDRKRPPK